MAKSKVLTEALTRIVPPELLDLTKAEVVKIVRDSPTQELQDKYARLMGFVEIFAPAVKTELVNRMKRQVKENGSTSYVSDVGQITLCKRDNVSIDEYSLKKYLRRKKSLGVLSCYDEIFNLVTKNKKVLQKLEDSGVVIKDLILNKSKYNKVKKLNPELENFEENNPTFYLKGLG